MPKVLVIVPRIYIIHNMRLWLIYSVRVADREEIGEKKKNSRG
jgi:hypothetical protein